MSKAVRIDRHGGPEELKIVDVQVGDPGPGEIRIRHHAVGLNFIDTYQRSGLYPFAMPLQLGMEAAGVVEAVGEGVTALAPGDRVLGVIGHGGLAEKVAVDAARLQRLPEGRSFEEGAALLLTYATTIHALLDRGKLRQGHTLLVLGAAGGVGLAAIELGKAFGATVIAAVSSEEKAAAATAAGADRALVYPRGPLDKEASKALAEAFKAAVGPQGADVIYDPVGGDYAEPALRAIGWEGRYLVVGFPAGIPRLPLNLTLLKSCDVCGVFWGAFAARDPQANQAHVERLFRLWSEGRIAPRVTQTYAFAEGGKAIAKMAARQVIGKVVVTVGS